jgi:hypothetical protein
MPTRFGSSTGCATNANHRPGRTLFNLWGVRFDPDRGSPIGGPFALTRFDTPALRISPDVGWTEIGISATRAVLTMETVRGNIWMMENVDR